MNKKHTKNVNRTLYEKLCTGCGTCSGVCPNDAISIVKGKKGEGYVPKINSDKCTNCGLCLKSCPGISVDFKKLSLLIAGGEKKNNLIENYLQCYAGYTTNKKLRYDCSSGGVVTQLLLFLLENKMITGALVTKMKKNNPLESESFIAKTKEQIISAKGSKYCPNPINIMLKKIHGLGDHEKIAIVGLPCHIQGIRKAQEKLPILKKKIFICIGLFCSHTPNSKSTKIFINKKMKICDQDIQKLSYRGSGWPGYMEILKTNEKCSKISLSNYWRFLGSSAFALSRCKLCVDATAELADISCGDAWLPEFSKNNTGMSVIIARNHNTKKIIDLMDKTKSLHLKKISIDKIIQSQISILNYKKIIIPWKIRFRKLFNRNNPLYNIELPSPGFKKSFKIFRHKIISLIYEFLHLIRVILKKF